jgi:hypothetical protein
MTGTIEKKSAQFCSGKEREGMREEGGRQGQRGKEPRERLAHGRGPTPLFQLSHAERVTVRLYSKKIFHLGAGGRRLTTGG